MPPNIEEDDKEIEKTDAEEEKLEKFENEKESEKDDENGNGIDVESLEKSKINLKDLDENRVLGSEISDEMKRAYIDYAMSVIVSRALPSVEDGLKPVHRRILYAMKLMGLEKGMTKKSARIVGDTMGKFHPHGDMAIYDALVRMAQDFSLRYPLVQGQGNFGCFTADTKVKLTDGRNLSFAELIEEHKQGKRNFTFTIDANNEIKIAEIKNTRKTRENAEIIRVILDNGEEIKCTPNHRFMLRDGSYKEAQFLESGDSLMPSYFRLSTKDDDANAIGYNMIFQPSNNSWNFVHVLSDNWNLESGIYQNSAGRIRHHLDFNKLNNNPDNIRRMNWKEHWQIHYNLTSEKHKIDAEYRKKLADGRRIFWDNKQNRENYSERMTKRNLKNWKNEGYRNQMRITLSENNKRYLKEHPEVIEEIRRTASITMKRLWQDPKYKQLFHEKIVASNKKRETNLTGKRKFLNICSYLKDNKIPLSKDNYEKVRIEVFGGKNFTTWDFGIKKYYNNDNNLLLCEINGNHKIVNVEKLNQFVDVYDLTVDKTHNFSLASGIFVHNSLDGDSAAASRYCITGDTLILTEKGIMPIKEISDKEETKINMKVLSYDGKKNKASKFFNSGKHKTIKILTKSGYSLEGSYNHPILTWKVGSDFKPIVSWKLLETLDKDDILIINRENNLFSKNSFDLKKYFPEKGFKNNIELPSKMNEDLAFLLGALVSEGSFHNKQISFNNKDIEFYNKVKSIMLSNFKGVQLCERQIKGDCRELSIYEQKIVIFLKNIGLKNVKSHGKEIPFSVLMSSKEDIKNFLIGLFEGDGGVIFKIDKRHGGRNMLICYDSKSKKLIKQIKILLLNFGIISNSPQIDKKCNCFKLCLSSQDNILRFYKELGFFSERKNTKLKLVNELNSTRLGKTDFIPFLNDYLRTKYDSNFILKNNFDGYNSLKKNYSKLFKIIDKTDKVLIDWLLKNRFYFDQLSEIERTKEEKEVFSVKVESNCHSFIANGFINHNTEAKLNKIAVELLQDIDKETVKFVPNFDNSIDEPVVLPGKIPNLLINGSSGIAVGMTTNIPPHNLVEVCDAITKCIDNPSMDIESLMEILPGPDFPTGGKIVSENLKDLYETGKAGFIIRGKITSETAKNKESLIVTEIPYQVNKSELVKQIAELVRDKKLPDVSDIRDESSKGKVRIVIELKKGADAQFSINRLYKYTKLQTRFDAVLVALVAGIPKQLNLKQIIKCYIDYRRKIVRKRAEFDLKKAEAREHIVKGLLIALENLDEVIKTIKKSRTALEANDALQKKFNLTKKQADAVLDLTLKQLTSLEYEKLKKEEKDLLELIKDLRKVLADENEILKIIKKELSELKKNYGDARKSPIIKTIKEIKEKDLVEKKEVVITITDKGYIKRMPFRVYNEQKRGGRGVIGAELTSDDFVKQIISCSTHDNLLLFTARGKIFWLKAYKVPETQRYGKGQAIVNLLNIKDDAITNVMAVKEFKDYLFMATKKGQVKKIKLELFSKPRSNGVRIINLPMDNSDSVVEVKKILEKQEVMLMSKKGQAIRFNSEEVRNMGRASYGVTGIKLERGDEIVSMEIVEDINSSVLTITEKGYGKRSKIKDYRLTRRACKGVINLKISDKTGEVVSTINVDDKDKFVVSTKKGIVIRTSVKDIRVMGRATQGVRIIRLQQDDRVSDIAKLVKDEVVNNEE